MQLDMGPINAHAQPDGKTFLIHILRELRFATDSVLYVDELKTDLQFWFRSATSRQKKYIYVTEKLLKTAETKMPVMETTLQLKLSLRPFTSGLLLGCKMLNRT